MELKKLYIHTHTHTLTHTHTHTLTSALALAVFLISEVYHKSHPVPGGEMGGGGGERLVLQ